MKTTRNTTPCTPEAHYIEMARTFAALSYQGVYLLNLNTNKFIYTSAHPLLRCGLSETEMLATGLDHFAPLIPDNEKDILKNIRTVILSSYANIPLEHRPQLIINLNFHIHIEKHPVMICHKLQLIDFDPQGNPHHLMGLVSPSVHREAPVIMAGIAGTDYAFRYAPPLQTWQPLPLVHLSHEERTMLRLTIQGHSIEEISTLMFKSVETIKFYRRQVFSKLNVKNISEAIAYATHYCMI